MGYNTASTEWPAFELPGPVKTLVDTLFAVLDNPSPKSGDRLADEIFASDGAMASHHPSRGKEGIKNILIDDLGTDLLQRNSKIKR
jgi:hypothetical protein